MKRCILPILLLLSCSEREKMRYELYEVSAKEDPSLLKVLSDPADSIMPLTPDSFIIKVNFSKPIDPSSLSGNLFVHEVMGDLQDGENQIGEGVEVKNWSLSDDQKNLLIFLSLKEGQYILHLKKAIRSIDGKELDGICDFKDESSDMFSSGFSVGNGKNFVTRAFCEANPYLSYLGPVVGHMEFEDHKGCSGEVNTGFPSQIEFELTFSFPTGKTSNYFLSKDLGKSIEIIDLTLQDRVPIYFSLDNRVSWKDDIEKFDLEMIDDAYPIYIRPQSLSPLHRFAIRINRFENLIDRYGLRFSDRNPDEDQIYEVCFTTYGTSNTLRVKEIKTEKNDGYISEIKIKFLTPDPSRDVMDAKTIIPKNFSITKAGFESVPFELELHREVISMQEEDVVILRIPHGYVEENENFVLTISYRVTDERGNTLDGNGDGYVEGNRNDNYIRAFP